MHASKSSPHRFPASTRGVTAALALSLLALGSAAAGEARAEAPGKATKKPAPKTSPSPRVTYADDLVPLLKPKCFSCHNQDRHKGGLALDTYASLVQGGSSGAVVAPGDADSSRIFLLVSHREEPHMPPRRRRLPDESLAILRAWIEGGALQTRSSRARAPARPAVDLTLAKGATERPEGPPPMPRGLTLRPVVRLRRPDALTALAASPWAPLVAAGSQRQVLLFDLDRLALAGVLPFPEGRPRVLRFSRSGTLLLAGGGVGGASGRVVLWDVESGRRVVELGEEYDAVLAADISADQRLVALGGPGRLVKIYSIADGALLHTIRKHTDWVLDLEFSPDGVLLASGDRQGGLFVFEALTAREYLDLRGHSGAVTALSWRADSNLLASASEDRTVRLWEVENGKPVKRWNAHGGGVLAVRFLRDGRLVTCGRDRRAKLWDGAGKPVRAFEALADIATAVAAGPEGKRIVTGDWTGRARVWSTADGKRLGELATMPPSLQERIAAARRELEGRAGELARIEAESAKARAAAERLEAELAALQKSLEEKKDALAEAREELERRDRAERAARVAIEARRKAIAVWEAELAGGAKGGASGA